MKKRILVSVAAMACLAATAVIAFPPPEGKDQGGHHAPAPSPALDALKTLAGDWEMTDKEGKKHVSSVFKVVAAGSAVSQNMFPGTEHEMVNMYHMDGDKVVMTHYCAAGNQPRMTSAAPKDGVYKFTLDKVSNMRDKDDMYMGELTLTIKDKDTFVEEWTSFMQGKKAGTATFEYTRKK